MPFSNPISHVVSGRVPAGRDLLKEIRDILSRERVLSGYISVIGSIERAWLGYFDWGKKGYQTIVVEGPLELLSCSGNVTLFEDAPFVHLHALVGGPDGRPSGGHVLEGCKVPIAEYTILVYGGEPLRRRRDEDTGMNLLGE